MDCDEESVKSWSDSWRVLESKLPIRVVAKWAKLPETSHLAKPSDLVWISLRMGVAWSEATE